MVLIKRDYYKPTEALDITQLLNDAANISWKLSRKEKEEREKKSEILTIAWDSREFPGLCLDFSEEESQEEIRENEIISLVEENGKLVNQLKLSLNLPERFMYRVITSNKHYWEIKKVFSIIIIHWENQAYNSIEKLLPKNPRLYVNLRIQRMRSKFEFDMIVSTKQKYAYDNFRLEVENEYLKYLNKTKRIFIAGGCKDELAKIESLEKDKLKLLHENEVLLKENENLNYTSKLGFFLVFSFAILTANLLYTKINFGKNNKESKKIWKCF